MGKPNKKGKSKKTKKGKSKKSVKRSVKSSKELIVYMAPKNMPLPPRYRTKFTSKFYGSVPVAAGSATRTWTVNFNDPTLPFNTVGVGGSVAFDSPNQTVAGLNPPGLSTLLSPAMYQGCRVYSSSCAVEFIPSALADTVEAYIMPVNNYLAGPISNAQALAQPLAKSQVFSSSKTNNTKNKGQLVNYCSQHKLLGVSKRAIEDDLSGNYSIDIAAANPNPQSPSYWQIGYNVMNAADLATPLDYRVSVTYYVELYELNIGSLIET